MTRWQELGNALKGYHLFSVRFGDGSSKVTERWYRSFRLVIGGLMR